MTALALAGAELRRVTRDRTFLFFLVVLPVLVILLVGLTTAGSTNIRIAVVPGSSTPLASQLVRDLEASPALTTQRAATRGQGVDALRRGVSLKDGRTLSGVIPEQNDKAVTVQTPAERVPIPRSDIAEMQQLSQSFMPEGLLTALGEENVKHLIAYLMSNGQVALPK